VENIQRKNGGQIWIDLTTEPQRKTLSTNFL
jgi:hypothetical protein